MDHFQRRGDTLYAEAVPLADLAARFGTPTYVYSRATLERHVRVLQEALAGLPHHLCYALKANSSLGLVQLLHRLGCDMDAVSGGELVLARKAGVPAAQIILSGVGKSDAEIATALRLGVRYLSAESPAEVETIARLAQAAGRVAPVSLRVNPDVDPQTHPHITTGRAGNKFGMSPAEAEALIGAHASSPHLAIVGLSCHIGSQITALPPFVAAAQAMRALVGTAQKLGAGLRYVGLGGGLGIPYLGEAPPAPAEYGRALAAVLAPLGLTLVLEPGRVIVGNAGVLLTRVVRHKASAARRFVVVDAGMNDLIRPALYGARHDIVPVAASAGGPLADVVGPVCESSDTFATGLPLGDVAPGEVLVIRSAGAYGMAMASTYNGRVRPAEVLVDGAAVQLLRARGTVADLWDGSFDLDGRPVDRAVPDEAGA